VKSHDAEKKEKRAQHNRTIGGCEPACVGHEAAQRTHAQRQSANVLDSREAHCRSARCQWAISGQNQERHRKRRESKAKAQITSGPSDKFHNNKKGDSEVRQPCTCKDRSTSTAWHATHKRQACRVQGEQLNSFEAPIRRFFLP